MLLSATAVLAGDLQTTAPGKAGMSAARLDRLSELNRSYVRDGKLAGVITLVARHGKIVHLDVEGTYGANDPTPLEEDTLFRIYSMTKPVTAVALMTLYEEGAFRLNDPVSKFLPSFAHMTVWDGDQAVEARNEMTMHHLLTHTAGLGYGAGSGPVDQLYQEADLLNAADLDEFVDRLAGLPLYAEPGERWVYGLAYDVLGAVAEQISGQPFEKFMEERIFVPLGMTDTFFVVPDEKLHRFPSNHAWDAEAGKLVTLDDTALLNSSFKTGRIFAAGGHGLVSTMGDYLKFCEMLRNGGALDKTRILSPKTVRYMTTDHLPATTRRTDSGIANTGSRPAALLGAGFGLGFGIINDPAEAGVMTSRGAYFWGGYAGTIFWIDPEEDLVAIAMMQLLGSPWPYREEMTVVTYQAVEELNHQ